MVTKIQKQIGISDFRKNLSQYFKDAKKKPLIVAGDRGKDTRVVLSVDLYNELVEAQEDQIDAQCLQSLVEEGSKETVLWHDVKKKHDV